MLETGPQMSKRHAAERKVLADRHRKEHEARRAERAARVKARPLMPNAALREAVLREMRDSGGDPYARAGRPLQSSTALTWSELAFRVWGKREYVSEMKRRLGMKSCSDGRTQTRVAREFGEKVCAAANIDPHEVGL